MTLKKVLKAEDEQLRDYELVLITNPEAIDEKFDATMDKVTQFITGQGGNIADVEQWGKKRLAYPIKNFGEGSYVLIRLKLKPESSKEVEANLKISDDILRHLLINLSS